MDMGKKKIENVDDNKMISMGCHAGLTFWGCSWTLTFFGKSAAEFETSLTYHLSGYLYIYITMS